MKFYKRSISNVFLMNSTFKPIRIKCYDIYLSITEEGVKILFS